MTRHVSTENLTRLRDADLRGRKARRAQAHLEHCSRCQETSAALGEIPAMLAGAQMPQIPAHLAARIETALATESAHRAAGQPAARQAPPVRAGAAADAASAERGTSPDRAEGADRAGRSRQGGRSGHARRARPRGLPVPAVRVLAAAAAVVIVGGGGYEIVSQLGGPGTSAASSSGAARSAQSSATQSRKPEFAAPSANTAFGAPAYGPPVRYQAGGRTAAVRPVRTATNYLPAQLSQQVAASLARVRSLRSAPHSPGSTAAGGPDAGAFSAARLAQLAGCINRVAAGRTVQLVDLASFRAAPATIIVTAGTGSAAPQVWVVGPGCSRSAGDVLAHQSLPGR
jgi:hypothetical protein